MKLSFKTPVWTAVILLAVSCSSGQNQKEEVTKVHQIILKDTSCVIDYQYPATISGLQDVAIYPQVSGRITAIKVKEGQFVNKGDVLFEIDDIPYRAAYDQALAQVEVSKAQLENARFTCASKQNLFDRDIISEYQLNLARNEVTTAEAVLGQSMAALKDAENNLSFTKVRTMGKGYIGSLPYKVGSLVGPNIQNPLTVVSDNSEIYADFSVQENTYLELLAMLDGKAMSPDNMPALSLITNLGTPYAHKGKMHSISGLISRETGALPVRSIFPNPDRVLLSGGSCKVVFSQTVENALVVPRASMKEIQNKLFVFVIRDGRLEQTQVNATRLNNSQWLLEPDGNGEMPLHPGDAITTTINRLKHGETVEVIK